MLGRKTFTQDEIDRAEATIDEQLAAYRAFAATSIVKLEVGDPIVLGAEDFERLAKAFFADLESRFR
ncbi:hypothetical protein [Pseudonocardia sp. T1-2H]|uniref:hypothetical protein n=1 Tax=Pseudonocardia sp. T1-2H TaxID=3128899 RepID=UPI0031017375